MSRVGHATRGDRMSFHNQIRLIPFLATLTSPTASRPPRASAALPRVAQPFQYQHRSQRNHLAWFSGPLQGKWCLWSSRVWNRVGPLEVRVSSVKVPCPVGSSLLLQKRDRVSKSPIITVSQGRHEVKADEDVVVVMDRIMESVPRSVTWALLVQLPFEIELSASLDRTLHVLGPFSLGINGECAHPLPGVQHAASPSTAPTSVFLLICDEPAECALYLGVVGITEIHEGARGIAHEAQLAAAHPVGAETAIALRESLDPQFARPRDPRIQPSEPEVRQDEKHPVRGEVLRPIQALVADPPSPSFLFRKDVGRPPFLRDPLLRRSYLGIILCLPEDLSEREVLNRGLSLLEQPVQRSL